ncbi:glycoside hydrolase [Campylobacter fetus]|nr:glycoside hydrolase [Campylobacter fetus]EAI5945542.1 glycoside hydrolase [Campylobacter fetus]EAJ0319737.1 glycoside hydrolase [Campylobacter fetus]EAJ0344724.1 glycoside hydrolase [Campylobacter fetus]EAJ1239324.1 glycoside hydrolase [Campylobacter fetus]
MKRLVYSVLVLFFVGCAPKIDQIPQPEPILSLKFEQNASILPDLGKSIKANKFELLSKFFSVWNDEIKESKNELMWAFNIYKNSPNKKYYGESKLPRSDEWFLAQKNNANFDKFKSILQPAITIANTEVRDFPTIEKLFLDPSKAGEGYPFDYLQESVLGAFHPLLVSHFSKDGAWAFVKSDSLWGFVRSKDIKLLTKSEADEFQRYKFAVFTKDNEAIKDENGNFLFYSRIGSIFPYDSEDYFSFKFKNNFTISKEYAKQFQTINSQNLKTTLNELLGQNYGWGGENKLRDCSLFIKDYFSSFGVWLPRNSKAQGQIGRVINLKNLTNNEKKDMIKKYAIPFLTLLYMPGHIMIYAGDINGTLTSVHDSWGIKTKDNGRAMIGKIAITDLEIGKGNESISDEALLLSKITSMNIIIQDEKSAFQNGYGVKIEDNKVIFDDNSSMIFDDGKQKTYDELIKRPSIKDMLAYDYPLLEPLDAKLIDAGRFRNEQFFSKIYGKTKNEVQSNLIDVVWLKNSVNKTFKFNSKNGAAKALQKVSDELDFMVKNNPNLLKYLDNPAGTFNYRKISKTDLLSAHSWGIAIDINVNMSDYWQWSKDGKYHNNIPKDIVEVFEKNGFIWGGRWKHFDTMHFEYRPEFSQIWLNKG